MAPNADPYRVLGLERGASLDDVKRAYRRLAKANHPDAAGEAALPRFLAIQAAYDQIAGPDPRARRPGASGSSGAGAGSAAGARRAWEADPNRAGATHRAYGGRTRTRPGPRPRPTGPSTGPRTNRPSRAERPPNKATLGSTSYDGADEPLDPNWGGASWYGTSSGTYWTLNPKEYADPRKHGPEYQARARRADKRRTAASNPPSETLAADAAAAAPGQIADDPEPIASEPPTHTTSSWWQPAPAGSGASTARPTEPPRSSSPPGFAPSPRAAVPPVAPVDSGAPTGEAPSIDAALASVRDWLDDRHPGINARVGRAVVGWAPIALGIGWIAGEASGCARFSADCPATVAPITWGLQLAALVVLIAVSRLARIASVATVATLGAILPGSVLLLATSDPVSMESSRSLLGALMVIAWVAGIGYGAMREFWRRPIDRPVS